MPKRRRDDHSDNKVETVIFSMPEDNSSTITPTSTTTFSPLLPEQVINVSEWTIETDRVSTSNTLFSSMDEPAPSMSFSKSDRDFHIPGVYHNYYDVVDVSDFQPPPDSEPLQPSGSANAESSKRSKVRLFFCFSLIVT
jgi:hypothetical protein